MNFKEADSLMRVGHVVRLPDWHPDMGVTVIDGRYEWVRPAWDGYGRDQMLAHLDEDMTSRDDWVVCWRPYD